VCVCVCVCVCACMCMCVYVCMPEIDKRIPVRRVRERQLQTFEESQRVLAEREQQKVTPQRCADTVSGWRPLVAHQRTEMPSLASSYLNPTLSTLITRALPHRSL